MTPTNTNTTHAPPNDPSSKARRAASSILKSQMQLLNAGMLTCMNNWERVFADPKAEDAKDLDYFFRCAIAFAGASARNGEALARLKTDSHQRISVERLAAASVPARIEEILSMRRALKTKKNPKTYPTLEGDGGER